jgi:hypothetical protein
MDKLDKKQEFDDSKVVLWLQVIFLNNKRIMMGRGSLMEEIYRKNNLANEAIIVDFLTIFRLDKIGFDIMNKPFNCLIVVCGDTFKLVVSTIHRCYISKKCKTNMISRGVELKFFEFNISDWIQIFSTIGTLIAGIAAWKSANAANRSAKCFSEQLEEMKKQREHSQKPEVILGKSGDIVPIINKEYSNKDIIKIPLINIGWLLDQSLTVY